MFEFNNNTKSSKSNVEKQETKRKNSSIADDNNAW